MPPVPVAVLDPPVAAELEPPTHEVRTLLPEPPLAEGLALPLTLATARVLPIAPPPDPLGWLWPPQLDELPRLCIAPLGLEPALVVWPPEPPPPAGVELEQSHMRADMETVAPRKATVGFFVFGRMFDCSIGIRAIGIRAGERAVFLFHEPAKRVNVRERICSMSDRTADGVCISQPGVGGTLSGAGAAPFRDLRPRRAHHRGLPQCRHRQAPARQVRGPGFTDAQAPVDARPHQEIGHTYKDFIAELGRTAGITGLKLEGAVLNPGASSRSASLTNQVAAV